MADHYHSKHSKSSVGPILLKVLIGVLAVAVVGGGLFAVWRFILNPLPSTEPTEATVAATKAPTAPPTEAPTEPPTESEDEKLERIATDYMKNMSLDEKVHQLFIVRPEVLVPEADVVTEAGDMTKSALKKHPVGGIIYFSDNLETPKQVKKMLKNTQKFSKTPLFFSLDEEGGEVSRITDNSEFNATEFEPMFNYKDKGEETATNNAKTIGKEIAALGFNLDFAPVADVLSNPDNTAIGHRAYSDKYDEAANLVAAAVKGFGEGGVMCSLKHFPGHGSSTEDSHETPAIVTKTKDQLISEDLLPFKSGIEAGADTVMVGHIIVKSMDDKFPATLSEVVVPELLRKELSYNGVVVSDSLSMGSITSNYKVKEIVNQLFKSDIDIFLDPHNLGSYVKYINSAIKVGIIDEEKDINPRVIRILKLKFKKGLLELPEGEELAPTQDPSAAATTGTEDPTVAPATLPPTENVTEEADSNTPDSDNADFPPTMP